MILVKAMKLAQEINNPEKALLLFNILKSYAPGDRLVKVHFNYEEIQLEIQNGKLNYARNVGNIIQQNVDAKRCQLEPFVFQLFLKGNSE